jgi:hypothetical protein
MTGEQVGDIEQGQAPTAYPAMTASNDVPRTIIHRIPDEKIASRGLRAVADAAQKARREFWILGGRRAEKDGGMLNARFKEDEMTEEEAKRHFLSDFESDLGLAKEAEPLRDLVWEYRDFLVTVSWNKKKGSYLMR